MVMDDVSLIVTAHPDDETLFFAGLILSRPKTRWHVVCATNGNADGLGEKRRHDFEKACRTLNVANTSWLGLPDVFEKRLPEEQIISRLPKVNVTEVFTHSIIGEYGHPHHQDVSYAVHHQFKDRCPVYSVAYNCSPEFKVVLNDDHWRIKCEILTSTYLNETKRFYNLLPVTFAEGFVQVAFDEVKSLYQYLTKEKSLDPVPIKVFRNILPYLMARHPLENRPF
jgi:hypothetical protein